MRGWRVSGAGNDFLAFAEPERAPGAGEVRAWCRRGLSLGADGLFVIRRLDEPRRAGAPVAVRMDHFNPDGETADLCINGARCAARLACELGWAAGEVELHTGAGPLLARRVDEAAVELALPAPAAPEPHTVRVAGEEHPGFRVAVGVPHFVLRWSGGLEHAPVAGLGPLLRRHADFGAAGTNVDFVRRVSPHRLEIRTWERGVEAETLACGTGVLAAVAVGRLLGDLDLPATVLTAGGCELTVAAGGEGRWTLTGDARLLARVEILPEATDSPQPPAWRE